MPRLREEVEIDHLRSRSSGGGGWHSRIPNPHPPSCNSLNRHGVRAKRQCLKLRNQKTFCQLMQLWPLSLSLSWSSSVEEETELEASRHAIVRELEVLEKDLYLPLGGSCSVSQSIWRKLRYSSSLTSKNPLSGYIVPSPSSACRSHSCLRNVTAAVISARVTFLHQGTTFEQISGSTIVTRTVATGT